MPRFLVFCIAIMSCASSTIAQSRPRIVFKGVGDLEGGSVASAVYGMSADGKVVVGDSVNEFQVQTTGPNRTLVEAFRWTVDEGMVCLGNTGSDLATSTANAADSDASVIVGFGLSRRIRPIRWNNDKESPIAALKIERESVFLQGVSDDGTVLVGNISVSNPDADSHEAFRWSEASGLEKLGDLPGGEVRSQAQAVSADGSVVVGWSTSAKGVEAFRWTTETGMVGLGDLPGGDFSSRANGISADGKTIVGSTGTVSGFVPFRWTLEKGMTELTDTKHPGAAKRESAAYDVSADGSIIVCSGSGGVVWDAANGFVSIAEILHSQGVDLTGWSLGQAKAISDDGTAIAGNGRHNGNAEGWYVKIEGRPTTKNKPPKKR